jgi:hypothetical protein
VPNEEENVLFTANEKNVVATTDVISEMKSTNPSSALRMTMRLGILGLNEDFVQLNEIMGY